MKIIIRESQYNILVEQRTSTNDYSPENIRKVASQYTSRDEFQKGKDSAFYQKAWKLGILDELIPSKIETPEQADEMIKDIIDNVRKTGEFSFNKTKNPKYEWIRKRKIFDITGKFEKAINDIKKILDEFDDIKIQGIINDVSNSGQFGGNHPDYSWFKSRTRGEGNKAEKFKKVHNQIKEIISKLAVKREWWGEKTIKQVLEQMGFEGIPPLGEYKIDDCKNSLTCKLYKFDVYLPYNKNNYMVGKNKGFYIPETGIIFEYDGIPHFEPIEHFGGEEKFKQRIHSDKEKNLFCKNYKPNPIKLVRIPYTSKKEEDIKQDINLALDNPSTFILAGDYPKAGWNK